MALSGTITGSTSNQYIDAKIVWSATQSIDGNYSMVTATLYYSRNNTGYTTSGTWSGSITINGTKKTGSQSLSITYNSNTKAITNTVKVPHNSDGTKTITISASGSISGTTLSSTSVSKSVTLTTIPRASSVAMSTGTMDSESTITITRASSSFTHTLKYTLGDKTVTIATKTSSVSVKWTPSVDDFASEIPSATYGTGTLTCTTYNGSTSVGSKSIKVRLNLPSNIKPKVGSLTLTPATITLVNTQTGATTTNTTNILVKGKNKLTLRASSTTPSDGSKIAYYTFKGYNASGTLIYNKKVTSTSTSSSVSISSVSYTGTLDFEVTATDARGRTSAATTKSITCYAYSQPSITSFSVSRSVVDGVNYLKCSYTPVYSSVNSINAATVTMHYNNSSAYGASGVVSVNIGSDTTSTYKIYLTIRDKFGGYAVTTTKTVYGETRVINITSDGTGIAFGKMAETSKLFECRWPSKFNGLMVSTGGIRTEGDGASNKYFETRRSNVPDATDDKHKNVRMQMYVGDAGYPTIRNQYSTDNGETWTTRSYLRLQDDGVYSNTFRIPEIQSGIVTITPSAANTPTSKIVTFGKEFSGSPVMTASPHTSVPGTTVLGVGTASRSTTGFTMWLTRTNTTDTNINWIAVY